MTEYIVNVDDESEESIIAFLGCKPIKTISALVRCRDCKHWDGVDTCDVIDAPVWDNDFCSMAERRSDEK